MENKNNQNKLPFKKPMALLIFLALMFSLTSCSDVVYPPKGATIVDKISENNDSDKGDGQSLAENSALDKYRLKKYDIIEKKLNENYGVDIALTQGEQTEIAITLPTSQHYKIVITVSEMPLENAVCSLSLGDETFGAYYMDSTDNGDGNSEGDSSLKYAIEPVYLEKGEAQLTLKMLRGNAFIESLTVINSKAVSKERFNISKSLSGSALGVETIELYEYLSLQFGGRALTAQHCTAGTNAEIIAINKAVGRYPAVRFGEANAFTKAIIENEGGDLTDDTANTTNIADIELSLSKNWHADGGIVAYSWMWEVPATSTEGDNLYSSLRTETDFSLTKAVSGIEDTGAAKMSSETIAVMVDNGEISTECMRVISDIDKVSLYFKELSKDKIPIIFNPLPDGASKLYWWGDNGDDYIKLWSLMHERMVDYHGLDNLIWVYSGGSHLYYPKDDKVDIIGESLFIEEGEKTSSQAVKLKNTEHYSSERNISSKKAAMVVMSSALPSPDILARDNSGWLMWGLYKGDYIIDENGEVLKGILNDLDFFYNHELTICLDNLPKK